MKTRKRLSKIRDADDKLDKLSLAHYNMTEAEYLAGPMRLARDFFELRHIDPTELRERVRRELKSKSVSVRTETEWGLTLSAGKLLQAYTLNAMRKWKPEALEQLARAMRRWKRHSIPSNEDAWQRDAIIRCDGNITDALAQLKEMFPKRDQEDLRRNLNRLKKKIFPKDT